MRYHYASTRMAKSGTQSTINAGEDTEQQEISLIGGGNAKWYSRFGRVTVSYNTKYNLTILPYHIPWYLPKGVENLCSLKTLQTND